MEMILVSAGRLEALERKVADLEAKLDRLYPETHAVPSASEFCPDCRAISSGRCGKHPWFTTWPSSNALYISPYTAIGPWN